MCPPPNNPTAHLHREWETLFSNAFSTNKQQQYPPPVDIDLVPNELRGDAMYATFEGLPVWSNNVNTLSLSDDLADLHELCGHFKNNNIGIAALQEINIDLTQAKIYKRVKAVFEQHFHKRCILICSTTSIRSETSWKPGSTLLVIMPQWAPYVVGQNHDELGRWCSATLQVKDQRQMVFYSFYNCCKNKITNAGLHTIYAQQ
jgi:hypothetical protein